MKAEFTRSRFGDCGSCGASGQYCAICVDNSQHILDKRIDDELTEFEAKAAKWDDPQTQDYIKLGKAVREEGALRLALQKYIAAIEDKSIYEHGFPEARLTPSNFLEDCNEKYIELVKEELCAQIEEILREHTINDYDYDYD